MAGWIILFSFVLLLLWLLIAPIRLQINTFRGWFRLRWLGIGGVEYHLEEAPSCLCVQILFFKKRFFLEQYIGKKKDPPAKEKTEAPKPQKQRKKKKSGPSARRIWRMARNLLRTFRIHDCRIWVDTDDYVRNAYLYPLSVPTWGKQVQVFVNYQGRNALILDMDNRLGAIALAFIRSYLFK